VIESTVPGPIAPRVTRMDRRNISKKPILSTGALEIRRGNQCIVLQEMVSALSWQWSCSNARCQLMRLRPFSRQQTYKYLAMARGAIFIPPRPLAGPPHYPLLSTLALTRKLTKVRRARPAGPPTSVVTTTVDIYPDAVGYGPNLLLLEPSYTITAKEDPYFRDLEPILVSPSSPLPSERPPLRRSPTSNLMTRWSRVDVPDSVLIAELGELRRSVELANGHLQSDDGRRLVSEPWCNSCIYGSSSGDDDQRWRKAEKSAFCRRELIKTELTYLEGILQLENKNVRDEFAP